VREGAAVIGGGPGAWRSCVLRGQELLPAVVGAASASQDREASCAGLGPRPRRPSVAGGGRGARFPHGSAEASLRSRNTRGVAPLVARRPVRVSGVHRFDGWLAGRRITKRDARWATDGQGCARPRMRPAVGPRRTGRGCERLVQPAFGQLSGFDRGARSSPAPGLRQPFHVPDVAVRTPQMPRRKRSGRDRSPLEVRISSRFEAGNLTECPFFRPIVPFHC